MRFFLILLLFVSCASKPRKRVEIEDFSLDQEEDEKISSYSDGTYLNDIYAVQNSIKMKSSFPFSVSFDKALDYTDYPPASASSPKSSLLSINVKSCKLYLKTTSFEANQFLYTDKWVTHREAIPKNYTIKLGHENNLYLNFKTNVRVALAKKSYKACKKLLYGKAIYLGKYNLKKSYFNLVGKSKYKPHIRSLVREESTSIYLYWLKGKSFPFILDSLENPVTMVSPTYASKVSGKSHYYIAFKPNLLNAKSSKKTLKIPFKPLVH